MSTLQRVKWYQVSSDSLCSGSGSVCLLSLKFQVGPPRKHALKKICIEHVYWSMCSGWLSGGDRKKEVWVKGKTELCHSQDPRHTYRDLWSWHSSSWIREVSSPYISALTDHWMCNIPGRQAWLWVIPQHPKSWRMAQSWGVVGESEQQPRHQLQSTLCFV